MAVDIHQTSLVDPRAEIGEHVQIGPYSVIESDTVIGEGTVIGPHVVVRQGARIGKNCHIWQGASIAGAPQDLKFKGEKTTLTIGDNTTIREFCTLNRGTSAHGDTSIGSHCLLMTYCHVAHDCRIGDNVVVANNLAMGGHVWVGDNVNLGGVVSIHQFCRVGSYAFVGVGSYINTDVVPFALTSCEPSRVVGVNKVGLERKGFSVERRNRIKQAFRTIFREFGSMSDGLEALDERFGDDPDIRMLSGFIRDSERGVLRMGRNH